MRFLVAALAAGFVLSVSPVHAALEGRDINRDGVTDAFFDTDLNITWLRDTGLNPRSTFAQADTWAANLVVGNVSDWRLPTSDVSCQASNCSKSEMGHLFYTELGNHSAINVNSGSFQGLALGPYWSGNKDALRPGQAWVFTFFDGFQYSAALSQPYSAMAVRDGDVAAVLVPEPKTDAMLLAGLGFMVLIARRRKVFKG
jgi:hypothetical protein